MEISRRRFNRFLAATGISSALLRPWSATAGKPKVVVVGGGYGGATAATYLKRFDTAIDVTLVEPSTRFFTCPFSNTVIGGINDIAYIARDYQAMRTRGIDVIHERADIVDGEKKKVTLSGGGTLEFDRCIVSPGIDFRWDAIEGLTPDTVSRMPHAWNAGSQTTLLRKQVEAMPDGGTFIISMPIGPSRCPPAAAERISLVAHYLKAHKPKSKIIALDAKQKFSKKELFEAGWGELYPGMIEYHNIDDDGTVHRIDTKTMTLYTDFEEYTGDVINFVPPQKAGQVAVASGLTDKTGWCPVKYLTFESALTPFVHVLGDASIANPMPKSGFAASAQAKVCAAAIAAIFRGESPGTPKFVNACYSLLAPNYGISLASVFDYKDGAVVEAAGSGGLSPPDASSSFRKNEARYAEGWYRAISQDIWG